jgi:hypothetical protein
MNLHATRLSFSVFLIMTAHLCATAPESQHDNHAKTSREEAFTLVRGPFEYPG